MSRGYQYNYSAIADDLYDLNFRQNKAKKTLCDFRRFFR